MGRAVGDDCEGRLGLKVGKSEDGRWKMEDGRWKMEDGGWGNEKRALLVGGARLL
ncbi:MAG: hypothetical protein RL117_1904 [Verrucomicrobiota bacterium]|jgi:hypothetical protein